MTLLINHWVVDLKLLNFAAVQKKIPFFSNSLVGGITRLSHNRIRWVTDLLADSKIDFWPQKMRLELLPLILGKEWLLWNNDIYINTYFHYDRSVYMMFLLICTNISQFFLFFVWFRSGVLYVFLLSLWLEWGFFRFYNHLYICGIYFFLGHIPPWLIGSFIHLSFGVQP